jgi:hypothetical protein
MKKIAVAGIVLLSLIFIKIHLHSGTDPNSTTRVQPNETRQSSLAVDNKTKQQAHNQVINDASNGDYEQSKKETSVEQNAKNYSNLSVTEFIKIVESTEDSLPTIEQARVLKEEDVHYTPQILKAAGRKLGDLATILSQRKDLIPEGIKFYQNCAKDTKSLPPVRALCLGNLKKYGVEIDESSYPKSIVNLAKKME